MKIKIKNILSASVLILSVFSVAHAAYPTSYWQIGQVSEVLEFNYGDDSIASNVMAIYPNGSVVVNTFAPSDGTAEGTPEGGQLLELDIGGDIGAEYYCDSEGENCFRPEQIGVGSLHAIFSNDDFNGAYPIDTSGPNYFNPNHGDRIYTNNGTKVYVYDSDDLTWEEGAPIDGDRVFNLHGRIVQTFDGNTSTWEPTYSKNMRYEDTEFGSMSLAAEAGDIVWNSDADAHCCHNGTEWNLCNGNGPCTRSAEVGTFDFACSGDIALDGSFFAGEYSEGSFDIPITITSPGVVKLLIDQNGFYAERTVILSMTDPLVPESFVISVYPVYFDGTEESALEVSFPITSSAASGGSCTGVAEVKDRGSFEFACSENAQSEEDYFVGRPSAGFIYPQIINPRKGYVNVVIQGPEFSSEEEVLLSGQIFDNGEWKFGEPALLLDLDYNGTGTTGWKSFSISSGQAVGSCVGEALVSDVTPQAAFTCTSPGTQQGVFMLGADEGYGEIVLPIANATAGATVELTVTDQDGFSFNHIEKIIDNPRISQTAITIPVTYNGNFSGETAGVKTLTITSAQADPNVTCTATVEVISPTTDAFTCSAPGYTQDYFVVGSEVTGEITLPITNAVPGEWVQLTVTDQDGFSFNHSEQLIPFISSGVSQTAITIPNVLFRGDEPGVTSGTKTLTITSPQANSSFPCTAIIDVEPDEGAFDFACTEKITATGDFQYGDPGDGGLFIPVTGIKEGVVTVNINHNGFRGSKTFDFSGDEADPFLLDFDQLEYLGTSGPDDVDFGITSPQADSGCVGTAFVGTPDECSAGTRVFSGVQSESELYELPSLLTDTNSTLNTDSKNYSNTNGRVQFSGVTGNCSADLECDNGTTQIVTDSEICMDCPGGTMDGDEVVLGQTASYDYDAFNAVTTQSVSDIFYPEETGVDYVSCTADVTCNAPYVGDTLNSNAEISSTSGTIGATNIVTMSAHGLEVGDQIVLGPDTDGDETDNVATLTKGNANTETRFVISVTSPTEFVINSPLNQAHPNPTTGTAEAGDHYIAETEEVLLSNESCEIECLDGFVLDNGVCIEANCDINTIIRGTNSGYGYAVNAVIPVGNSRTFNGINLRTECLLSYVLTVTCNGPNNWTFQENNPTCEPEDEDGNVNVNMNFGTLPGGGPSRFNWCGDRFNNKLASGECHDYKLEKTVAGATWNEKGKFQNTKPCQEKCLAPGDCSCSAGVECLRNGDDETDLFNDHPRWGVPEEICALCHAGDSSIKSEIFPNLVYSELPPLGFVTPVTVKKGNEIFTCAASVGCSGSNSGEAGTPSHAAPEICECIVDDEPYIGDTSFSLFENIAIGETLSVLSTDVEFIGHGVANNRADFECDIEGLTGPLNETCDPTTIVCDDEDYIPDPEGACACVLKPDPASTCPMTGWIAHPTRIGTWCGIGNDPVEVCPEFWTLDSYHPEIGALCFPDYGYPEVCPDGWVLGAEDEDSTHWCTPDPCPACPACPSGSSGSASSFSVSSLVASCFSVSSLIASSFADSGCPVCPACPSGSGAEAFFNGPRINDVKEFLVKLFQ